MYTSTLPVCGIGLSPLQCLVLVLCRLPSIPLECYQQHSYADKVEGIRRKKRQQPKPKAQGEEEVKSEVKGEDAVEEVEVKLEQNLAKEVEEMEEEEELITRLNVSLRMYDRGELVWWVWLIVGGVMFYRGSVVINL